MGQDKPASRLTHLLLNGLPFLPVLLVLPAWWLLGADLGFFLGWWLTLILLGVIGWPLASRFLADASLGYLPAKALGLALLSLAAWLAGYLHLLPLRRWSLLPLAALLALLWLGKPARSTIAACWRQPDFRARIGILETFFGLLLLIWAFARGLKPELDSLEKFMDVAFMSSIWRSGSLPALDPWLAGHSVNYYYFGQYVYALLARLTGISIPVAYNLGLATTFAMTGGLSFALGSTLLQLARQLGLRLKRGAETAGGLVTAILVTVAGNSHSFFYNPAAPGHRLLQALEQLGWKLGDLTADFWFADATRFIGYNPDTTDKTIHEFPFYSFLVADLHAHLVNLAFVLLLLTVLAQYLAHIVRQSPAGHQPAPGRTALGGWLADTVQDGYLALLAGLLAIFMMGNYWDFAIYLVVSAMVLLFAGLVRTGRLASARGGLVFTGQILLLLVIFLKLNQPIPALGAWLAACVMNHGLLVFLPQAEALPQAGARLSWLLFLAHLLALPFNLAFDPIAKTIARTVSHTPLYQLVVLWGPHVLAGLIFLGFLLWQQSRHRGPVRLPLRRFSGVSMEQPEPVPVWQTQPAPPARRTFAAWLLQLNRVDLLQAGLLLCALGLLLVPEWIYVVDIYSGDYKRANTMFKFTYQAFVLLSLVWGYAIVRLAGQGNTRLEQRHPGQGENQGRRPMKRRRERQVRRGLAVALAVLAIAPAWYPLPAARQWLGEFSRANYRGLDGLAVLADKDSADIDGEESGELADDLAAIAWLNKQVSGQPVILEADGSSYTDYCRISAFTGLPTVLGWETHEWLWRTSAEHPDAYGSVVLPRQEAVRVLYTGSDQVVRQQLIDQYQIRYIIIGNLERAKYGETDAAGQWQTTVRSDLLEEFGVVVFTAPSLEIIGVTVG